MTEDEELARIAAELEGTITAIVRIGIRDSDGALSVDAAIYRLAQALPEPVPSGAAVWIGRLKHALAEHKARDAWSLLRFAVALRDAMRCREPDAHASRLRSTWLGSSSSRPPEALQDTTLVEIARERVDGIQRHGIGRRYLIAPATGEILIEEVRRASNATPGLAPSVGPCPRVLHVGLAEADASLAPRRVRVRQYSVSVDLPSTLWDQIVAYAENDFVVLRDRMRQPAAWIPGLCEPAVILNPARLLLPPPVLFEDAQGHRLALACARAEQRALESMVARAQRRIFVGRLVERDERLAFVPLSVLVERDGKKMFRRIT